MKAIKVIGGLAVLSAAGFGLAHLLKTGNTGKKSSISIENIAFPKFQGAALLFGIDIAMDNPTNNDLTLKKPYITTSFNGDEIANSLPSDETTIIKANQRTIIRGINLLVPFVKLGSLALSLITGKMPNMKLDFKVSTVANGLPYSATKTFTI